MNIVSISWVRNEADVIEAFVRHHCRFLDRMIIIDNRSKDNTGHILRQLQKEGLPLDLRYDDSFTHLQGEALTAVLSELRSDAPDFVIPLDADEFLTVNEPKNIRAALEDLPRDIASLIRWHTYIPMPDDDLSEPHVPRRIRHRRACELPQWHKVIIPGSLLQKNVKLRVGSHALVDAKSDQNSEHRNADSLFLAHFPVRSAEQIAGKVFGGWLSHVSNPTKTPGTIFQWKAIFDELKSGKEISADTLMRMALDYGTEKQWKALPVEEKETRDLKDFLTEEPGASATVDSVIFDPIPTTVELKYEAKRLAPLRILAESAEILAQEVAYLTLPQA